MKKDKDNKGNPVPVRFENEDTERIQDLAAAMGISNTEVVRMAVRFALPKFASGEVSIKDLMTAST